MTRISDSVESRNTGLSIFDNMKTPALDKLATVREKSQAIGMFIDSLSTQGLILCEEAPEGYGLTTIDESEDEQTTYIPTRIPIETILAGYFDIDLKKCEEERQQILEELRSK